MFENDVNFTRSLESHMIGGEARVDVGEIGDGLGT